MNKKNTNQAQATNDTNVVATNDITNDSTGKKKKPKKTY